MKVTNTGSTLNLSIRDLVDNFRRLLEVNPTEEQFQAYIEILVKKKDELKPRLGASPFQ